jgi:hypothetical protein
VEGCVDNAALQVLQEASGNEVGAGCCCLAGAEAGCASGVAQNDFELTSSTSVPPNGFFYFIQAIDGAGNLSPGVYDLELTVIDVSDETAPVVTASQSFSYAENQTANADTNCSSHGKSPFPDTETGLLRTSSTKIHNPVVF